MERAIHQGGENVASIRMGRICEIEKEDSGWEATQSQLPAEKIIGCNGWGNRDNESELLLKSTNTKFRKQKTIMKMQKFGRVS